MANFAESLGLEIVSDNVLICFKCRIASKLVKVLPEEYRKLGSNDTAVARGGCGAAVASVAYDEP